MSKGKVAKVKKKTKKKSQGMLHVVMHAYIAIGIAALIACIALVSIIASEWCEDINEAKAAENDNTKTMELIPHDIFEVI
uniref:Uncharacterized protein n=2 Tax=Parascaris univalens TaxID=6257 RepID=A0A915A3A6_PARUN